MAGIQAMHVSRVDLNLFVVFDTIHAEGGITRAAEKLHLSQPAISHALARLRELFGDPLFVRQGQAMVPTPLARSLVAPVREALRALEGTLDGRERFDAATSHRRFVLGTRAELEAVLLPPLVSRLASEAPQAELAAVRLDRRRLETDLASGALDLALDVLQPVSAAIRTRRLGAEALVVALRAGHPAIAAGPDLEAYLALDHVLVSSRRRGAGLEDVALQKLGASRRVRLRCQQYFAAFRVVARTDLAVTLPASHAAVLNERFGHALLPLPFATPGLERYLYWHDNVDASPAHVWLRALAAEVVALSLA
jgi:DNA-binding transcriptional LysR family regulator